MAGFFPPKPLGLAGYEQMTDLRNVEVTQEGLIRADFKMRQAQLAFLVLQGTFHGPARESHMEPGFEFVFERVPNEEPFFLFRVQRIVSPKEMVTAEDLTVSTQPERSRLDLPHHRPLVRVLDVEGSPRLARHRLGVVAKFLDAPRGMTRLVAGVVEPTL